MGNIVEAQEVSDYLGLRDKNDEVVQLGPHTDPTLTKVEMVIAGVESEFDKRTKHSWGHYSTAVEIHNIPTTWDWGRGMPVHVHHRSMLELDEDEGDKLELWNGLKWNDQIDSRINYVPEIGKLYLRFLYRWLSRYSRLRIKYRYGTMEVPAEIKFGILNKVCAQLIKSSFAMESIQFGQDRGITVSDSIRTWEEEFDRLVEGWQDYGVIGY